MSVLLISILLLFLYEFLRNGLEFPSIFYSSLPIRFVGTKYKLKHGELTFFQWLKYLLIYYVTRILILYIVLKLSIYMYHKKYPYGKVITIGQDIENLENRNEDYNGNLDSNRD